MATAEVLAPVVSDRRRAPSPEVIDVDSLDEQELFYVGFRARSRAPLSRSSSSAGPSSAPIIIVDSDDEQDARGASGASHGMCGLHAYLPLLNAIHHPAIIRRPLPPPRPVEPRYTPSVHPRPISGHALLPFHTGGSNMAPPPPIIRPNPQPFPFEAQIRHLPRRERTPPAPLPPRGAARSHHQPAMGLGGGLIALNRQNAINEVNRREEEERRRRQLQPPNVRRIWDVPHAADFLYGAPHWQPQQPQQHLNPWFVDEEVEDDDWHFGNFFDDLFGGIGLFVGLGADRAGRSAGRNESPYKPTYTHPEKPMPGFSFDFAPPDVASTTSGPSSTVIVLDEDGNEATGRAAEVSPSAVEATMTLVCARCMDPLVLSTNSTASGEEKKNRKVWALGCGHMLDGKCIEAIMRPPPPPPVTAGPELVADFKGKGKARADAIPDMEMAHAAESSISHVDEEEKVLGKRARGSDRKGKGKAVNMPEDDIPMPGAFPTAPTTVEPEVEDNSMRSRLRPRHPRGSSNTSRGAVVQAVPDLPSRPSRPLPRRRGQPGTPSRGKGKGKRKAAGKTPEDEYRWKCPVAGCGHECLSACYDGEWTISSSQSAVAVFV